MNDIEMTYSIKEISMVAEKILQILHAKKSSILVVYGELGSGKTTLIKTLGGLLGCRQVISSPTYTIRNSYSLDSKTYSSLIHFDLYRITSKGELEGVGILSDCMDSKKLVCIEWPKLFLENKKEELVVTSVLIEDMGGDLRKLSSCKE